MENLRQEASFEGRKALRLRGLLSNAYSDYISSRILFNEGKLREGCILANQCLEKQMKAYIEAHNEKENNSHHTVKLLNTMVHHKYPIAEKINKDFIKVLNNIYLTRYFEQLSTNYHYTIVQFKFLAELDYIMSEFLPKIHIKPTGQGSRTYDLDIKNNNPHLHLNNYILNKIPKGDFLIRKQKCEELLLYGNNPIIMISEVSAADNQKFIYPAFKVTSPTTIDLMDWSFEEFGVKKNKG